jgi:hypothetical protein
MRLLDDERQLLLDEIDAVAAQLRNAEAREVYAELRAAVVAGEVTDGLLPTLERLLELGLETGRIREVHSAHGEMAATRVFQRTPKGSALKAACDEANAALEGLQGQPLDAVSFSVRGPGAYTLTLNTDQAHVTVHIDRHGVRVRSVEVGA